MIIDTKTQDLTAKKSLGQNFLVDRNIARKIVSLVHPSAQDKIVEIGSGRGALTRYLVRQDGELIVFEKDERLAQRLKSDYPEIFIVEADILEVDWSRVNRVIDQAKVIGCLPYNIASPFLWDLVFQFRSFVKMVFTVQKEVASRIVSKPGNRIYGALSIWIQTFVHPQYEFGIPPHVFRPRPRVDSAVITFFPREVQFFPEDVRNFICLLRLCFQARRKQLRKILKSLQTSDIDQCLLEHGIDPNSRPEQLAPHQFVSLSNRFGKELREAREGENRGH